ncbi:hypothetical protein A3860_09120 [Niastella vici]|uniref:Zinc-dependent metalloprotease n=1 Tax=Niastella vici TaxID=1703345 RepID=A0A1V9FHM4_9BACT|nr:zinc-dependent metalloprotease [Niastella vici]OQP57777.1 hypothetical protein A3860_09120 [Niastella vici]
MTHSVKSNRQVLVVHKRIKQLIAVTFITVSGFAQQKQSEGSAATGGGGNAGAQPSPAVKAAPKAYKDIITAKAVSCTGLFIVHKVEDKIYFELPDSILNHDMLIISRLAKAGADMRSGSSMSGYAGDVLNESVVRFEKGPNNKLFIRDISYSERVKDTASDMYKAVMNSNIQPISLAFDIRATRKDSISGVQHTVIELTDIINGDNDLFFWGGSKGKFSVAGYQPDKSYLQYVKSFPINTEIRTVKTYMKVANNTANLFNGVLSTNTPAPKLVTVELNTSIVMLPEKPMQARYADDRVGYFSTSYTDFDANPQGVKRVSFAERWRLEPKKEDMQKYNRGELVEPVKPIVIYIDPETPAKWVPYLIQGINDWQVAFEKAGFKNAIIGKMAPTAAEDSTWSLEDARHSAIVYKPSAVPNASGPHIVDPRSGEVIETHINWYHNVMKLVHDWYFVQAAAVDTAARTMHFSDALMGQLIRFVSSHEVGHTLGLLHNFGSSSTTPVEKLRDKKWVEANGHTPSIMDYARFNYVAQPEDSISEKGLFPRIGEYDKWAIEWGYRLIPDVKTATEETPTLNKWIIARSADKRYWFGYERSEDDPRSQNEDLGDNAMKAGEYGIKNLKRIMTHLVEWTKEDNEGYDNLQNMHVQLFQQFNRYVGHVLKNIGGRYETFKSVEQPGPVYEAVPEAVQSEAMRFIHQNVFITPTWLLDKKILSYTGNYPMEIINALQDGAISKLLSSQTLSRLMNNESVNSKTYTALQFFNDLYKGVWSELETKAPIDVYRRNLQKLYIDRLSFYVKPPAGTTPLKSSEISAVGRAQLVMLRSKMRGALPVVQDTMTKYHLQDLIEKIDNTLSTK